MAIAPTRPRIDQSDINAPAQMSADLVFRGLRKRNVAAVVAAIGLVGCGPYKYKDVQDVRPQACHDLTLEANTKNNGDWRRNVDEESDFQFTSGDTTNVPHFYEDEFDDSGRSTSGWVVFQVYGFSAAEHGTAADDSDNPWINQRGELIESYIRFVGLNDSDPLNATEIFDTNVKLNCSEWNGLRYSDDGFCVAVHLDEDFVKSEQVVQVEALLGCVTFVTVDGNYTTKGAVPSSTKGFCQGNEWGDCNPVD